MPKDKKSDLQKQLDNRELSSHIQIQIEQESHNIFKNDNQRRKALSSGNRKIAILAVILLGLFVISVTLIPLGSQTLWAWRVSVIMQVQELAEMNIIGRQKLAACAAVPFVGMAMAAAGATFQGLFKNPMASPTTLGVQAGGTLGGLIYILFFLSSATLSFYSEGVNVEVERSYTTGKELLNYLDSLTQVQEYALQLWEVAGCFFGVALVVGIARLAGRGKINTVTLMLVGSIFSTVIMELAQCVQYIILYNKPEEMEDVRYYLIATLLGGSSGISGNVMKVDKFLWMAVPISICLAALFVLSGRLNIMAFGEAEAKILGVPVRVYQIIFIVLSTILVADVLSFCGAVNMLGFIVPHFARYLVGPDFKKLIPASTLLGGITTLLVWDVCCFCDRLEAFNMYTGVVCCVMAIFFILFYGRNRNARWD